MIVIPTIKNLTISAEFIIAICWLGLILIFLEVDTRIFVKDITFTVSDADDFGFYNLCHCLLCCATNYRLSLRVEWGSGKTHADSLSEVVLNTTYVVAMEMGSGYKFFWLWLFLKRVEGYINSIHSLTDYNDLISYMFRNESARVINRGNSRSCV